MKYNSPFDYWGGSRRAFAKTLIAFAVWHARTLAAAATKKADNQQKTLRSLAQNQHFCTLTTQPFLKSANSPMRNFAGKKMHAYWAEKKYLKTFLRSIYYRYIMYNDAPVGVLGVEGRRSQGRVHVSEAVVVLGGRHRGLSGHHKGRCWSPQHRLAFGRLYLFRKLRLSIEVHKVT